MWLMATGRRPRRGKKQPVKHEVPDELDRYLSRFGALLRILYYLFRLEER